MKYLICILFLAGIISCTSSGNTDSLSEADIRGSWEQLTWQDGKWVIFKPCNASNLEITWTGDTLRLQYLDEVKQEAVKSISPKGKGFHLQRVNVSLDNNGQSEAIVIEPVDSMKGVTRWYLFGESSPRLLVRDKYRSNYEVKEQPCGDAEDRD